MEKLKFGWWSVLEMVDVYADYCYQGLMPKNFLASTIDAITFPLFKIRRTFYFFLILKHKISYRIGKLFDKREKIEIINIDTTD